jgi:hypothetical protein
MTSPRTRINITGDANQTGPKTQSFCQVCYDAGKTRTVFSSHYVRETPESNSKVVCPTLLSQTCNYCRKLGHTISHCQILNRKKNKQYIQTASIKLKLDMDREMDELIRECEFEYELNKHMCEFETHMDNQVRDPHACLHPELMWYPYPTIMTPPQATDEEKEDNDVSVTSRSVWNTDTNWFDMSAVSQILPTEPECKPAVYQTFYHQENKRQRIGSYNAVMDFPRFDKEDAEVCTINRLDIPV